MNYAPKSYKNEEISINYRKSQSYIVPCSSSFRDRVTAFADSQGASVADLARGVLLLVPNESVMATEDPGEPAADDREVVKLQSGPSKGRSLRRKPRLQLRLPIGYDAARLRRALALALKMSEGEKSFSVESVQDRKQRSDDRAIRVRLEEDIEQLRRIIGGLAFEPLRDGISSRSEALYVLGFAPTAVPDQKVIRGRYRRLALVFHPDSPFGDHQRMSQLNEALEKLTRA
jgi:hypothetical protein